MSFSINILKRELKTLGYNYKEFQHALRINGKIDMFKQAKCLFLIDKNMYLHFRDQKICVKTLLDILLTLKVEPSYIPQPSKDYKIQTLKNKKEPKDNDDIAPITYNNYKQVQQTKSLSKEDLELIMYVNVDKLNTWESKFIDDLIKKNRGLTDKQYAAVKNIVDRQINRIKPQY